MDIMMKTKDLTKLFHQPKVLRNMLSFRAIRIAISLCRMAPFSLKYRNMAPNRVYIIEKYDACVGVLSNC